MSPQQNKNIIRIGLATVFLLMVPLAAMQFTDEVVWDPVDFVIAGTLLFGTGLAYELIAGKVRSSGNMSYRFAVGLGLGTALILIWMNLAVGLIGDEGNPANLLYGGVIAVGVIGAIIARLQPHGMSRALFATALAQALVPLIALIIWKPEISVAEPVAIFLLNGFFAALFVGSAFLFRQAHAKTG